MNQQLSVSMELGILFANVLMVQDPLQETCMLVQKQKEALLSVSKTENAESSRANNTCVLAAAQF